LRSSILIAQLAILPIQTLSLLLQILQVAILLLELLLQVSNFCSLACLFELSSVFALGFGVAFILFELGFEFEGFEDLNSNRVSWAVLRGR